MKRFNHFASVALACAIAASQVPAVGKTQDIGVITAKPSGNGDALIFGNSFRSLEFIDHYSFMVADEPGAGSRGGVDWLTLTLDPLHVKLTSVTLSSRIGTLQTWDLSNGALTLVLPGLDTGAYRLDISGSMTSEAIEKADFIGYAGVLLAPVPEAADFVMTAMGMLGVALMVRRRKVA